MFKIACFGEVLWDVFPKSKNIGGAPLNVALRLSSFKNEVAIISCVGNDADGKYLIDFIKRNNILINGIQISEKLKTSQVVVELDNNGIASYTIEKPCAWDAIDISDTLRLITKESDVFIYGSLASRMETTKSTLLELLSLAKFKIFDVNLRPPHYSLDVILELMNYADLIKFNDEELIEICDYLNYKSDSIEDLISFISKQTNTEHICVTLGANGAVYFNKNKIYRNSGYSVNVVDTVGAGDSFLATFIHELFNANDIRKSLDKACAVGAIVASKVGATPLVSNDEIEKLINA